MSWIYIGPKVSFTRRFHCTQFSNTIYYTTHLSFVYGTVGSISALDNNPHNQVRSWALSIHLCTYSHVQSHYSHTYSHMTVTRQSHYSHTTVTWQSHDSHTTVTRQSHDSHTTVTWQSHDSHTTVTWQSHDNRSHDSHMTVTRHTGSHHSLVAETWRFFEPISKMSMRCLALSIGWETEPWTTTMPWGKCRYIEYMSHAACVQKLYQ